MSRARRAATTCATSTRAATAPGPPRRPVCRHGTAGRAPSLHDLAAGQRAGLREGAQRAGVGEGGSALAGARQVVMSHSPCGAHRRPWRNSSWRSSPSFSPPVPRRTFTAGVSRGTQLLVWRITAWRSISQRSMPALGDPRVRCLAWRRDRAGRGRAGRLRGADGNAVQPAAKEGAPSASGARQ